MFRRNFTEAKAFYVRNIWMASFCALVMIFTTCIVFLHGLGGVCYSISLISMLLGFIVFFRLGCSKRQLFDVEDIFTCLVHVFLMDLHYYLAANEFYEISKGRKFANFICRLLFLGVFFGLAFVFMSLSEEITDNHALHPVFATIWFVLYVAVNIVISAFIERQYRKLYGVNELNSPEEGV